MMISNSSEGNRLLFAILISLSLLALPHQSKSLVLYQSFVPRSQTLALPTNPTITINNVVCSKLGGSLISRRTTNILSMKLEINIRIVARKNSIESTSFLQESYETYTKRMSSTVDLYTTFHKSNQDLIKGLQSDAKKGYGIICLDEKGDMYTSIEFSEKMYKWLEEHGSRLVFVIGGAEGLPSELKQYQYASYYNNQYSYSDNADTSSSNGGGGLILNRSPIFMSLSKMTFTHPWARTILVEQIYRASEIHKGSGYHKE